MHSPDVGGLCAESQHCWVTASWAQVLTTNMKLQAGICPPSCLPVGVCAHQHVCVSIGGRHVANRKLPKKPSLSKQRTTDTGNNVASPWGHNGDVGSGNRRKWAVDYLSSSTVTTERVLFLFWRRKTVCLTPSELEQYLNSFVCLFWLIFGNVLVYMPTTWLKVMWGLLLLVIKHQGSYRISSPYELQGGLNET